MKKAFTPLECMDKRDTLPDFMGKQTEGVSKHVELL